VFSALRRSGMIYFNAMCHVAHSRIPQSSIAHLLLSTILKLNLITPVSWEELNLDHSIIMKALTA
jgi:hypothetical protein